MEKELYIARDDYKLALSESKPHLFLNDIWFADGEVSVVLNPDWFPEITKEKFTQENKTYNRIIWLQYLNKIQRNLINVQMY